MRRIFALLFCLLPSMGFAQACGTTDLIATLGAADRARLDALVAPHPYPRGLLFDATKGESRVTVVGTIHLPDPRLAPIVEAVRADVEAADLLILEVSAEDQAAIQAMATTKPDIFFLTEGPTLIELLSEEEWQTVTDQLGQLGVPGFFAAKFQPWYLALTLSIPPCVMSTIMAGGEGLDAQIENIAEAANVPVATLDDVDALFDLLAGDPLEDQLDALRLTLEMNSDGNAMTSTLIERYFQGYVRETWEFGRLVVEDSGIENAGALFDQMSQSLLVDRNMAWEPKIVDYVQGKTAVLAVGAAHLSGEDGVLRALERDGYTITERALP